MVRRKYIYALVIALMSIHGAVAGEHDIVVTSTIADTSYMIGDIVEVVYEVKYSQNLNIIQPSISGMFGSFEVMKFEETHSNITSHTVIKKYSLQLIAFDEGRYSIPAVVFVFEDSRSHKIITKPSSSYSIDILGIALDSGSHLKEIPPEYLKEREYNYLNIALIVLAVIGLSLIAVLFILKRPSGKAYFFML